MKLSWTKVGTLLAAPIIVIVAGMLLRAVVFPDPALQHAVPILNASIIALGIAWAVLLLIGAESEARKQEAQEVQLNSLHARLSSTLASSSGVVRFGNARDEDVVTAIVADVSAATEVKNTLVGVPHISAYEGQVKKIYEAFFKGSDDGQWLDLASYKEAFSGRFGIKMRGSLVGDRHIARILRHNVPLINFTIIRSDHATKVYFGWVFTGVKSDSPVFYSEDPDLTAMFGSYFDLLWNEKTTGDDGHVKYDSGRGVLQDIDVVDKVGRWVTVAHAMKDGEPVIESYAVLDIAYEGKMTIKGDIFKPDGGLSRKGGIHAKKCYVSLNRVNFDYALNRSDTRYPGRCLYAFEPGDDHDTLSGFFVNDQTRVWKDVVGIKVAGRPSHSSLSVKQELVRRYMPRLKEEWERAEANSAQAVERISQHQGEAPSAGRKRRLLTGS